MSLKTTDLPGLAPMRVTLANGVSVVAKETRKTPAVAIHLAVRAGSICDPADSPGAMYLLSRVIDRGTTTRSADAIADELDSRGISLTINVTRHLSSLVCTCLAADFAPVLALLADIIMVPSVPDGELTVRKGEVITALRQDEDNPAIRAVEGLMALLYGSVHPYGRPAKGTLGVVEQLTREQLTTLHATHFAPAALSAVVVGDVEETRVVDLADSVFGSWQGATPAPIVLPRVPHATERRRVVCR